MIGNIASAATWVFWRPQRRATNSTEPDYWYRYPHTGWTDKGRQAVETPSLNSALDTNINQACFDWWQLDGERTWACPVHYRPNAHTNHIPARPSPCSATTCKASRPGQPFWNRLSGVFPDPADISSLPEVIIFHAFAPPNNPIQGDVTHLMETYRVPGRSELLVLCCILSVLLMHS